VRKPWALGVHVVPMDRTEAAPAVPTVRRLGAKRRVAGERGLPKPEIDSVELTPEGVVGDYNVYRTTEKAGDPAMAVLVVPLETIEALNRDGWPVRPGDLGENITTEGVPGEEFRPGQRFRVGSATLEISKACEPCTNLYVLPYVGEARGPAFLKATVGRRGWYARVLRGGRAQRGDRFERVVGT
jgi:MOSC domain-containing protein YiiM